MPRKLPTTVAGLAPAAALLFTLAASPAFAQAPPPRPAHAAAFDDPAPPPPPERMRDRQRARERGPEADRSQRNPQRDPQRDPMSGPRVDDRAVPLTDPAFGGEGMDGARRGPQQIPHPMFLRAVQHLSSPELPETLRLTPEQSVAIGDMLEGYATAVRRSRIERAEEVRELREAMRPPRGRERTPEEQAAFEAARERLDEIQREAPTPGPTHAEVVALLNDAQRGELRRVIAAEMDRLAEIQRGPGDARPGDPRLGGDGVSRGGRIVSDDEVRDLPLPEGARERILLIPPEQRAMRLTQLFLGPDRAQHAPIRARLARVEGPVSDAQLQALALPERFHERLEPLTPEQRHQAITRLMRIVVRADAIEREGPDAEDQRPQRRPGARPGQAID